MTSSTAGLQYFDLSNRWGQGMPQWPSSPKGIAISTVQFHAMHGCQVLEWEGIQHRGTHMDAPIHVLENTPDLNDFEPWRFFGTGVVVSIPKDKWGVVTAEDLEKAEPKIQKNDIVIINTGSHKNWGDNDAYYQYSPGLYKEGAEWLVEKQVKLVGIDVQALDHPLGTKLVDHGPGPTHHHLFDEYREETGGEVMEDFPYWEPAHKAMLTAGIPGIENIGGDVDKITGKRCTFMCYPWRWPGGDGCGVRVIALLDPQQKFRIEKGESYARHATE